MTSRLIVEGARWSDDAIFRIDCPAARVREMTHVHEGRGPCEIDGGLEARGRRLTQESGYDPGMGVYWITNLYTSSFNSLMGRGEATSRRLRKSTATGWAPEPR